jgi:hypothetical protein
VYVTLEAHEPLDRVQEVGENEPVPLLVLNDTVPVGVPYPVTVAVQEDVPPACVAEPNVDGEQDTKTTDVASLIAKVVVPDAPALLESPL